MRKKILEQNLYETWNRSMHVVLADGDNNSGSKITKLAICLPNNQFIEIRHSLLLNFIFVQ